MNYVLDLLQGAGIATGTGIRPFLPAIVTSALARADAGIDFDGTPFVFLESPLFLLLMVIGTIVVSVLTRRRPTDLTLDRALLGIGIALGALFAAATLDDRFAIWWPGLIVGALAATLAGITTGQLLTRVRGRLDAGAQGALILYADGAAVAIAGLSILFPPFALVAIGLLLWLLFAGRKRADAKYAGLRTLK